MGHGELREIMRSDDPNLISMIGPGHSTSMLSLTDEAARANEFLQTRNAADEIAAR